MSRTQRSRVTVERGANASFYQPAQLRGWEILGLVSDADGTGALVRNLRTGAYCRANCGVLRSLPHNKVQAALDGAS